MHFASVTSSHRRSKIFCGRCNLKRWQWCCKFRFSDIYLSSCIGLFRIIATREALSFIVNFSCFTFGALVIFTFVCDTGLAQEYTDWKAHSINDIGVENFKKLFLLKFQNCDYIHCMASGVWLILAGGTLRVMEFLTNET